MCRQVIVVMVVEQVEWPSMSQINQGKSSAPSNNPTNNSVANTYTPRSSAPPNTSTSKRRKGSITSDTLNASRNASRYREVLRGNESQASMHGPRGSTSGI